LMCFAMSVFYRDACPGISFHFSGVDHHCPFALLNKFGCIGRNIHARKRTSTNSRERFIRKHSASPVRTKSCVSKLIKKWRITRSVLDKIRHHKKTLLKDEKFEDIRGRLQISSRRSLRHVRQVCLWAVLLRKLN
jgi:hypothetical protein